MLDFFVLSFFVRVVLFTRGRETERKYRVCMWGRGGGGGVPTKTTVLRLRSNAGMVKSDLEVDVLDELGSSYRSSSLGPHSLSRKSAPDGHRRVLSSVWVG